MNSKIFLKTACDILFDCMDVIIKVDKNNGKITNAREIRRNPISQYLRSEKSTKITQKIKDHFLTRVDFYIYPEKYKHECYENTVEVFLNKAIYLYSTLFNMNFSFLRNKDFNKYREDVYNLTVYLTEFFVENFECDENEILDYLMSKYDETLSFKHSFSNDDLNEFINHYNNYCRRIGDPSDNINIIKREYYQAIDFVDKQIEFFEILFYVDKCSDDILNRAEKLYILLREYYEKYGSGRIYKEWGYYIIDSSSERWKEYLINTVFQCDVIFHINSLMNYIFTVKKINFLEIVRLFDRINKLQIDYDNLGSEEIYLAYRQEQILGEINNNITKKYAKNVDGNAFVIHNYYFNKLYTNLLKVRNYIFIKKRFDYFINMKLLNEIE